MNSTELYIFSMNFGPTSRQNFYFPEPAEILIFLFWKYFMNGWINCMVEKLRFQIGLWTESQLSSVACGDARSLCVSFSLPWSSLWRRQIQAKLLHFCVCGFISKWQIYAEKKETINVRLSQNVTVRHSAVLDAALFSSFSKSFLWIFLVCLVGLVVYGVVRCI